MKDMDFICNKFPDGMGVIIGTRRRIRDIDSHPVYPRKQILLQTMLEARVLRLISSCFSNWYYI